MRSKKVYVAGAIRGDRSFGEIIRELIEYVRDDLGYPVLTEHLTKEDPTDRELSAVAIERRDISWIDEASYVIAEFSGASTGTGREIEYARNKHHFGKTPCKVLCVYRQGREFSASAMVRGMVGDHYPNVRVADYKNLDGLKGLVRGFLGG